MWSGPSLAYVGVVGVFSFWANTLEWMLDKMTAPPMGRGLFIVACLALLVVIMLLRLVVAFLWAIIVLVDLLFLVVVVSMPRVVRVLGSWEPLSKYARVLWYSLKVVWCGWPGGKLIGGQGGEGAARA